MEIKVEISARHVHLASEDFVALFGDDNHLNSIKKLSQEDDFASSETVKIIGQKGEIDNVRVIGPFREYSQVELSYTEARNLGIDPPLKISGDLPGENIRIVGPKGEIQKPIAIIAKRHLHLSPQVAESLKISDGDKVKIRCFGEREIVFEQVVARIKPKYTTAVHLDTDEGNAAGVMREGKAELIGF